MRRFVALLIFSFVASLGAADRVTIRRSGSGSSGPSGGGGNPGIQRQSFPRQNSAGSSSIGRPRTEIRRRNYGVPQPAAAQTQRTTIIRRDRGVVNDIQRQRRVEIVPNQNYWHNREGVRYNHRYYNGVHWYGFYHGPHYYWTRYYGNRWWWFDVHYNRWSYWWDGYWWWAGPGGVMYVYVDDNYYPYENGVVAVQSPPSGAPSSSEGQEWKSGDGKRMVQAIGVNNETFLYDTSTGEPRFMKFLASGVEKARFSGGQDGKPLWILLEFKSGGFALYDMEGNTIESPDAKSAAKAGPPPEDAAPPTDIPVPPQ